MGAKTTMREAFGKNIPKSILDVGCGVGTWLKACQELGAKDVLGIDGVKIPEQFLKIETKIFRVMDLTKPFDLKRNYALVLCLEVGEHLQKKHSNTLIKNLTRHGNTIIFSAACPGQGGQNHINCQWPVFWQEKFNLNGFECFDFIREKIWNLQKVEPWYRQNMFLAKKSKNAGKETRLNSYMHPELFFQSLKTKEHFISLIENGSEKYWWYFYVTLKAIIKKTKRRIYRG